MVYTAEAADNVIIPDARVERRVKWIRSYNSANLEAETLLLLSKLLSNQYGTLTIRAAGKNVEFDFTLSQITDERL